MSKPIVKRKLGGISKLKASPPVASEVRRIGKLMEGVAGGDGIRFHMGKPSRRMGARGYLLTVNEIGRIKEAKGKIMIRTIRKYN